MSLAQAFKSVLSLTERDMQFQRPGNAAEAIKAAPSNYARNLAVTGDMVVDGKEFVISKSQLDALTVSAFRRGDRLIDSETGEHTIIEVREMHDLGGSIIGFRVRTG